MRVITILVLLFLSVTVKVSAQINLCDTVTVLKYEPIPVATSPGHFTNGYELQVNDITYHVVVNKMKRIEFVSTSDTAFRTGTIAVGTTYFNVPKKMIKSERPNYGWGYEVTLKNGWTAVFDDGLVAKSLTISRKAKIGWFYKITDCKEYTPVSE